MWWRLPSAWIQSACRLEALGAPIHVTDASGRLFMALLAGTRPCLLFEFLYSLPPLSSGLNERTTYRTQECLGLSEPGTYRQHIPLPENQSSSRGCLRPIFVPGFGEPLSTWA